MFGILNIFMSYKIWNYVQLHLFMFFFSLALLILFYVSHMKELLDVAEMDEWSHS